MSVEMSVEMRGVAHLGAHRGVVEAGAPRVVDGREVELAWWQRGATPSTRVRAEDGHGVRPHVENRGESQPGLLILILILLVILLFPPSLLI
eukprot:COSAG01_NODE_16504_length_1231_cov_1.442580_1_plen_92_part_00